MSFWSFHSRFKSSTVDRHKIRWLWLVQRCNSFTFYFWRRILCQDSLGHALTSVWKRIFAPLFFESTTSKCASLWTVDSWNLDRWSMLQTNSALRQTSTATVLFKIHQISDTVARLPLLYQNSEFFHLKFIQDYLSLSAGFDPSTWSPFLRFD